VDRLLFEQSYCSLAAFGFQSDEAERFTHGHAQFANGLFVVDNQQAHTEFVFS
jgi:hypothetical protein